MGQDHSTPTPPPTHEQLSARLTQTFATKCYTPLELYCFKETFRSLADHTSNIEYWSEATLCRFLELPDALLGVGAVLFQLVSYLGAFPFPGSAPAILTREAVIRAVTVLTGRWEGVLKGGRDGGRRRWRREVWRGLCVFDRAVGAGETREERGNVDVAVEDEGGEEEEEEGLVFEAFEMMDAIEVFKLGEESSVTHALIPSDNFLRFIQLMLLAAPVSAQESLAVYAAALKDEVKLARLRDTAGCMLASFGGVEETPGVKYGTFEKVVASTMPYLLNALQPLFEHFLFPKDFDLSKRKGSTSQSIPKSISPPEPVLAVDGDILDMAMVTQLASFLGPQTLFRRLQPLYSGNTHGFSMGQFEKSVFNWKAPSILLVTGSLIDENTHNSRERSFLESLPFKRLSSSIPNTSSTRLVYGAYIPVAWKSTPKSAFGTASTQLFQLSPVHDVFTGSASDASYAYFSKPPSSRTGLGFGSPLPSQSTTRQQTTTLPLGPVSLHIDDTLTYAAFTHLSDGGGAFQCSPLPTRRKQKEWQDRFEIEALEVYGCGGTEEADEQRKAWAWEEREAMARKRVNLGGTGDVESDRELLRMAGLIGKGQSGGSMG